jgi:hypothetical protein
MKRWAILLLRLASWSTESGMTKFEELTDIITRNKNKDKKLAIKNIAEDKEDNDIQLAQCIGSLSFSVKRD